MIQRENIESFAGKNADYYFQKWAEISADSGSRVQWNWAAAIGGVVWLLYRKLYLHIVVVVVVAITDAYITVELEEAGILPAAVATWDKISYWVYAAVFGSWGNYWYYQKYRRTINEVEGQYVLTEERLSQLAVRGGTNIQGAALFLMLLAALAIWVFMDA